MLSQLLKSLLIDGPARLPGRALAGAVGLALAMALPGFAAGADVRLAADGVQAVARQPDPARLELDYWPAPGVDVVAVQALIGDVSMPAQETGALPAAGQAEALLLLIDTSDPARSRVVRRNARHVRAILDAAAAHHRFGLARLDTEFELVLPIGSEADTVAAAAGRLKAKGATTELFRHTLAAIEVVAQSEAARKAIVLFSDGLAEDTAYTIDDVVAAARRDGVAIYALGYSASVAGTRAFQSLIRMSEETGGMFIAADRNLALPADFAAGLLAAVDRGARVSIDLSAAAAAGLEGEQTLTVQLETDDGAKQLAVPVVLPMLTPIDRAVAPSNLVYLIVASVLLLLALAAAGTLLLRRQRRRRAAADAEAHPLAFIEFLDDSERRHPVGRAAVRIGRSAKNDVRLNNSSISAYHAEIQRRRDGTFIITDLDSLNGVAINDEDVDVGQLRNGDVVDLGEVRFRFALDTQR